MRIWKVEKFGGWSLSEATIAPHAPLQPCAKPYTFFVGSCWLAGEEDEQTFELLHVVSLNTHLTTTTHTLSLPDPPPL
jgi:hypothetical protein